MYLGKGSLGAWLMVLQSRCASLILALVKLERCIWFVLLLISQCVCILFWSCTVCSSALHFLSEWQKLPVSGGNAWERGWCFQVSVSTFIALNWLMWDGLKLNLQISRVSEEETRWNCFLISCSFFLFSKQSNRYFRTEVWFQWKYVHVSNRCLFITILRMWVICVILMHSLKIM